MAEAEAVGWYANGAWTGRRVLTELQSPQSAVQTDGWRMAAGPAPPLPSAEVRTLYEAIQFGAKRGPLSRNAIGSRSDGAADWTWLSWEDLLKRIVHIAHGLPGVIGGEQKNAIQNVGLLSEQRLEASLVDLALTIHARTAVYLHPTWNNSLLASVIRQMELKVICVDTLDWVNKILEIAPQCANLKDVVLLTSSEVSEEVSARCEKVGIQIHCLSQLEESGESPPHWQNLPKPSDKHCIIFTRDPESPKAVALTHANLIAQTQAMAGLSLFNFGIGDILYSGFSLAYIPQRVLETVWVFWGCRLLCGSGELTSICMSAKPTLIHVTPKTLTELRQRALAIPGVEAALREKEPDLLSQPPVLTNTSAADATLKPVRELLGNRLKAVLTCFEPVSWAVLKFVRLGLCVPVMEGYLATEAGGVITTSHPWDLKSFGHVGGPVGGARVKFRDVTELGLRAGVGAGEVMVSGPSMAEGYLNNPALQAAKYGGTGSGATCSLGDVAMWRADGTMKLLGRRTEMWRLATGELVDPSHLEAVFRRSTLVEQVAVLSGSGGLIGALVVPNPAVKPAPDAAAVLADCRREAFADGIKLKLHKVLLVSALSPNQHHRHPWPRLHRPTIAHIHRAILPNLFAN